MNSIPNGISSRQSAIVFVWHGNEIGGLDIDNATSASTKSQAALGTAIKPPVHEAMKSPLHFVLSGVVSQKVAAQSRLLP